MNPEEEVKVDISQLHKERAGIQSAFTRTERKIYELINHKDCKHDQVDEALASLNKTFDDLVRKVNLILDLTPSDGEEQSKLRLYVKEIEDRHFCVKGRVQSWREDAINPSDSASQAGSRTSNCSIKSKASAKKAALQVKLAALEKSQALKRKKMQIEMEEENLKLQTELKAAEAEIKAADHPYGEHKSGIREPAIQHQQVTQTVGLTQSKGYNTRGNHDDMIPSASIDPSYDILQVLQLPKVEISTFDGNPLKYWAFMRSFDTTIGDINVDNSAKLNRLLQYCTGKARELIDGCIIMDPDLGYPQARRLLAERFGNKYLISKAWVDKVTDIPNLKPNDSAGLRKYADSVRSCVLSLSAMGRLSEVDNQLKMKQIVERLPLFVQCRWRKKAVGTLHRMEHYPDIEDLATFLEDIACELDDPVFGVNIKDNSEKQRSGFKSSSNFVAKDTEIPENKRIERQCRCCKKGHPLYQCPVFKEMNLQERKDLVIRNRLCFNCFSSRHLATQCNKNSFCETSVCKQRNRKHSQLLHDEARSPARHPADQTSIQGSSYGVNGAGKRIALPIVPVCVKGNEGQVIKVYALLDPGSTNTFCSAELSNELHLKGDSAWLSLNTLTDKNCQSQTKVVSLRVLLLDPTNGKK